MDREPRAARSRPPAAFQTRVSPPGGGRIAALGDLAIILRSKNAGIGYLTLDILFADRVTYEAAKASVTREVIAEAYGVGPDDVSDFVYFEEGFAIKATLPRPQIAGGEGLGETDLYGSGHYAPLLGIEVLERRRDAGARLDTRLGT